MVSSVIGTAALELQLLWSMMPYLMTNSFRFFNSKDPKNPNKILAAELLRGIGGILLNKSGQR